MTNNQAWPALPLDEWEDTRATLHMWMQMVGKVRMAFSPLINHWWEVPLYVNARGLTTSPIPHGDEIFEIQFDFIAHTLDILTSGGARASLTLRPCSVADFYRELMGTLQSLGINVKIFTLPSEVIEPIHFEKDDVHASYDSDYANRFWRILVSADTVMKEFNSRFIGKVSPVHLFWGGMDLAASRFSGRRAPERPGADLVQREGYSHEVSSVGFWPGAGPGTDAVFYSYMAPVPTDFSKSQVRPAAKAFFSNELGEFLMKYEDVRLADSPKDVLLEFFQSTYEAGATLAGWDRATLER